jgi:uncharacterized repeat protein (TIGR01451 family)
MELLRAIRQFFRDNPRMVLVIGVGIISAGLMAWWATGGFSFQVGQFFAADLSPSPAAAVTAAVAGSIQAVQGSAVLCAPEEQTITAGQSASLQAVGGDGTYQWDVSGGGIVEGGGNQDILISYRTPGRKAVRVSSAGSSALCMVTVRDPAATVAPNATGQISIVKSARLLNGVSQDSAEVVDVAAGDTVQFTIEVRSLSSSALNNLRIQDTVPLGMSYAVNSTYIESQNVVDGLTEAGLPLGTLQAGDHFTVQWSAIADHTDQLRLGVQEERPRAAIRADGVPITMDDVLIRIRGTTIAGPGGVQTGPGDITALAFVVASLTALLYTAYTRSAVFRRGEVTALSEDQGPLDFRS